jgi:hypothetical protein
MTARETPSETPSELRTLLDPTSERNPAARARAARLASLAGKTIGLLDISKPRGDLFLDRVEAHLSASGAQVKRYAKPTFAKLAPVNLRGEIAEQCDAVIEALAD